MTLKYCSVINMLYCVASYTAHFCANKLPI